MIKSILILILLTASASCFAQSNLVLYDANNIRVGIIMEASQDRMLLRNDSGYLFTVGKRSGNYADQPIVPYLIFGGVNCSGQAYVETTNDQIGSLLFSLSGRIFQVGPPDSDIFARTEYGLLTQQNTPVVSKLFWNGQARVCESNLIFTYTIPATVIPLPTGLPTGPGDFDRVYPTPFTAKVEVSDALFCNGFENCPVQP